MKKLLVVLLALTFVVAMATAAFAVTTTTVDGKVEWTLKSSDQFGGSVDGDIVFDLSKDFGEGYSAGLKFKLNNDATYGQDGNGYIKMVKDFGTLTFQTGGLGGNAAKDLGGEYDMTGNAGVMLESSALMEGLALTVVLNDNYIAGTDEEDQDYYNYLLKAVYTGEVLSIGAGYQAHTVPASWTTSTKNDMMAFFAGYNLSEALVLGFEYASRPNIGAEGASAIQVKADYTADPLTVNGKIRINTGAYDTMKDADMGSLSAWNFFTNGVEGTALKVDAAYQLTEALKVALTLEDILSNTVDLADDQLMSYKLSVTDVMSEQLTLDGWYAGYGDNTELGAKATYTFVAGLVGTLEVKSATDGVEDAEGVDAANSYTVTIKATL